MMGGGNSKVEDVSGNDGDKDGAKKAEADGGPKMEFDPDFKGPIQKRGCTDMICCLLFIACSLAFVFVGAWAYTKGDPKILLYPTDSDGNLCGYGDYKDKPYLFFFDMIDCGRMGVAVAWMGCPTPQVCVKECPDKYWQYYTQIAEEEAGTRSYTDRDDMICKYDIDPESSEYSDSSDLYDLVENEDCAAYYLESEAIAGRCIPSFISDVLDDARDAGEDLRDRWNNTVESGELRRGTKYLAYLMSLKDYGNKAFADIRASWWMILIGIAIAACFSLLWILLMRFFAGIMVWVTLLAFLVIFGAAFYYSLTKYLKLRKLPGEKGASKFTTNLDYYWQLTYTWLVLAILTGVLFGVMLIIMIFLRKRIKIAIAVIKETARALKHMVSVLFFPLIPFAFMLVTIGYWAASALFLASMGNADFSLVNKTSYVDDDGAVQTYVDEVNSRVPCDTDDNTTAGEVCNFLHYGGGEYTKYVQGFQIFMLLWILNWLVALTYMTMAGAFASYYWAFRKPDDIPKFPVLNSVMRALFYHTGTMAFGALILTLVQMVRIVLEYLDRKLKGKDNIVAKFFVKCLKCCFWCLEKFIKFINKNAYIMCAVYGRNFCFSAFTAFGLIIRNIVRVVVVDKVTDFICFIGKLVCTGIAVFFAYLFFSGDLYKYMKASSISNYVGNYTPSLNYYLVPVILIGIATYVVASAFFAVFSMGVDTIFMCFLQDIEVNDGSEEKPYFMNKDLMGIIGEKNEESVDAKKKE